MVEPAQSNEFVTSWTKADQAQWSDAIKSVSFSNAKKALKMLVKLYTNVKTIAVYFFNHCDSTHPNDCKASCKVNKVITCNLLCSQQKVYTWKTSHSHTSIVITCFEPWSFKLSQVQIVCQLSEECNKSGITEIRSIFILLPWRVQYSHSRTKNMKQKKNTTFPKHFPKWTTSFQKVTTTVHIYYVGEKKWTVYGWEIMLI